jgi:hypothetical protein
LTPISTGWLITVPEAAVMQEHPAAAPATKDPPPVLVKSELLTNQVAELETSWKLLTPFELNSPWAKNCVGVGDADGVPGPGICALAGWMHAALVLGGCEQTRIAIKVIGVDVGTAAVELVLLEPQLGKSKAKTST